MALALPKVPHFETANHWYAAQFVYISSSFSFIQLKYFDDRLAGVYSWSLDTSNREDCPALPNPFYPRVRPTVFAEPIGR
jgi:hypothetical protein